MLFDPKWNEIKVDAVGEVLLRAAAIMELYGWCKGRAVDEQHRVCAIGAITAASLDTYDCYQSAYNRLAKYVGDYNIPFWSDNSGKEKVVEALREAAYAS